MRQCQIDGTMRLRVFGGEYQTGYDPSSRGTAQVQLIADSNNLADANAVALMTDGARIGYLSRAFAEIWQPRVLAAASSSVTLTAYVSRGDEWTLSIPRWPEHGPHCWPSTWIQTGMRLARLTAAAHRLQREDTGSAARGQIVREESRLVVFDAAGDQIGETGLMNRSPRRDLDLMLQVLDRGPATCVIDVDDRHAVWAIVNSVT